MWKTIYLTCVSQYVSEIVDGHDKLSDITVSISYLFTENTLTCGHDKNWTDILPGTKQQTNKN